MDFHPSDGGKLSELWDVCTELSYPIIVLDALPFFIIVLSPTIWGRIVWVGPRVIKILAIG